MGRALRARVPSAGVPNMSDPIFADPKKLADGWCDRRALIPLRHFLPGYFALNGLTDGWELLSTSLKDVLAFAKDDITQAERDEVKRLIRHIDAILNQR